MTTDTPTSLPEALAEIEQFRLALGAADIEIAHLRARITELEAGLAITHGTLEQPTPDEPATIVHDVAPNAPR